MQAELNKVFRAFDPDRRALVYANVINTNENNMSFEHRSLKSLAYWPAKTNET